MPDVQLQGGIDCPPIAIRAVKPRNSEYDPALMVAAQFVNRIAGRRSLDRLRVSRKLRSVIGKRKRRDGQGFAAPQ
jgi:hypothetical protein